MTDSEEAGKGRILLSGGLAIVLKLLLIGHAV